ncbi:unnamed protein product [Arctogadus glacialis]
MSSHSGELRILSVFGQGEGPLATDGHDTLFTASEVEALNSLSVDHSAAKSLERGERLVGHELSVQVDEGPARAGISTGPGVSCGGGCVPRGGGGCAPRGGGGGCAPRGGGCAPRGGGGCAPRGGGGGCAPRGGGGGRAPRGGGGRTSRGSIPGRGGDRIPRSGAGRIPCRDGSRISRCDGNRISPAPGL